MLKNINKFLTISLVAIFSGLIITLAIYFSITSTNKESETTNLHQRDVARADNPNKFIELHNLLRTRASESSSGYAGGYQLTELTKARRAGSTSRLSATYVFTERGPGNVPGRTRALIVDPEDATHRTWFAGGVGGGIWKTSDGGISWINKTPDVPNLAISWMVMAASDHSIMYAGTGEGYEGALGIKGSGIYKSINHGETWTLLTSTTQNDNFHMVNRIIVDPTNPDIILAATSNVVNEAANFDSGIFKSIDGGNSWIRTFFGSDWVQQIIATPNNFNTLYAAVHSVGIYKSIDAGDTWTMSSTGLYASGRIEMAVSGVNTSRLYASVIGSISGTGADLYVSDDAGVKWENVTEENNGDDIDFLGGQGGYDNTVMAHPYIEDMVYVGGVNLFKFEMIAGTVTKDKQFLGAEEENTSSFLELINFGAKYYAGKVDVGNEAVEDFVSVEIRFGPDGSGGFLKQFAHRFTIPTGDGSGVPDADYTYQDYVEVPFQVWDVTTNRQLMVAFRDQQEDGAFNLLPSNTDDPDATTHSREYIYISSIDYNTTAPDPGMAANGQHVLNNLYFIWPVLAEGGTWDEANLPESKFIITYEGITKRLKRTTSIADAYSEFGGNNSFTQTMGSTNQIGVHPDHHNIVPILWPEEGQKFQLLNANDGGVYVSLLSEAPGETDNSISVAGLSYNTSQFYAADKAPGKNEYVGGMQDNGSWMSIPGQEGSSTSDYRRAGFGDGFGCAWNHADASQIITTAQFGSINKSKNGGATFSPSSAGITDSGPGEVPFLSEIENLHSDPNVVYTATASGVWRSANFADNWTLAPIGPDLWISGPTIKTRISQANSHIVWAGTAMIESPRKLSLHVSTDEGVSFSPVNNYTDIELGTLSGLATHPVLDSTAFALFSFAKGPKILRTDNLGVSWFDITGFGTGTTSANGFPDVAVYDLLVMPYDTAIIWAGTEIGIFESTDSGSTWHILSGNMPATAIWDMKIVEKQVVLGTYGRGIWSTDINELPGHVFIPEIISSTPSISGELLLNVNMSIEFDSSYVYIDDVLHEKILAPTSRGLVSLRTNYSAMQSGKVHLRSFYKGLPYVSHKINFQLFVYDAAVDSYENNFNTVSNDFSGFGFRVKSEANFLNGALHSEHPYVGSAFYQNVLKLPIRVKSANALINFNEVVIVEPGADGSVPGSSEFNDYVVVQGSFDGITWVNLVDEYDASSNDDWLLAHDFSRPGVSELYKFRSIDLLNTFMANDEVLIRFVLAANEKNESWGWTIDNIKIQTETVITGIEPEAFSTRFSVFPNPITKNYVTISHVDALSEGQINLFNMNGQLVLNKPFSKSDKTLIELPTILKNGIYSFIITTGTKSEMHKVIINRNL